MQPAGRAITSDWSVNSFIIVIYVNVLKFSQNFLSKALLKYSHCPNFTLQEA